MASINPGLGKFAHLHVTSTVAILSRRLDHINLSGPVFQSMLILSREGKSWLGIQRSLLLAVDLHLECVKPCLYMDI